MKRPSWFPGRRRLSRDPSGPVTEPRPAARLDEEERDVDPGPRLFELANYGLETEREAKRSILLRVDERERMGSNVEFALGGVCELIRAYGSLLVPGPSSADEPVGPGDQPFVEGDSPWNES